MVGLTSVLLSGLSGMRASQTAMATISQNIANANTPGYVRTEVTLSPRSDLGAGAGVEVTGIKRAADRFLATASYIAEAARGSAAARADILSRAQSNFGDPAGTTSVFASLDNFWSAMTEIGVDPASQLRRGDAVTALQSMYSEVQRIGESIQSLIAEADQRIADSVEEAQSLIDRIAELNLEVQLNKRMGADSTGAENAQGALIDQLSSLMDVRVTPVTEGGVHVRTSGGALLVGVTAANLSYSPNSSPYATHGVIKFNEQLGTQANLEPYLLGGEIKGLLQARDTDLVNLSEALGGFAGALADALNEVHNENASSPALGQLVGRQTGLLGTDALGFTGNAVLGVTTASGNLAQRLTIDFDAQTITGEAPAAVYSFAGGTVAAFTTALNSALGAANPAGTATFVNGVLTVNVGSSGGAVIQQAETDPSDRAGRGFSHFFGLNDLVSRPTPLFFETGLQASDLHGLAAGGEIAYEVRDSLGRSVATRTIAISGGLIGGDWGDLVTALNATGTGLGEYGTFALDPGTGRIGFTPNDGYKASLVADSTLRGGTGVSFSSLHGLSQAATGGRALEVGIDAQIAANTGRLAVGRPDLTADIGDRIIEAGDNRGSAALVAARDTVRGFPAAGAMNAQTTTLAVYAARLGGEAGRMATDAERGALGAEAVALAAADRRAEVESVSLDDELLKMTTFQNAYAAAARVIQAATDMLDILMSIGYR
ncbi:flagellar hook-associated protein FlgK [Terricaulis silvestris]|uniref:Flagellar hook-associated protein 1 n=1 Tax=Terricaulis silvestris TaxID=2686094 RepID=A0A6I6MQZ2_9CAUL|nr:flagellar hook-associated protein FlgK [Terricaulis silvestris]QGZ93603.1 Flagellar hook-associated protein 1 [Terricaulis silvestris]